MEPTDLGSLALTPMNLARGMAWKSLCWAALISDPDRAGWQSPGVERIVREGAMVWIVPEHFCRNTRTRVIAPQVPLR